MNCVYLFVCLLEVPTMKQNIISGFNVKLNAFEPDSYSGR